MDMKNSLPIELLNVTVPNSKRLEEMCNSYQIKGESKKNNSASTNKHDVKKQQKVNASKRKKNEMFYFVDKMKSPIGKGVWSVLSCVERINKNKRLGVLSCFEEYRKKHMVDRTEENLQILLKLNKLKPKPTVAQKVLEFHQKELKKREIEPEIKDPEPESILFPEEKENQKKKKKKK
ncbi:uncharacterized protein CEXT_199991 [Caerostris extrusa]|uniref:Uncharacterized protein n=1 Tax=Caerostris extrusa TaxID=172846 RepID=A0AAV4Y6W2_CAEEX|nr:uncharacterized protein CEXT_199991 [Caerostris extrusa]